MPEHFDPGLLAYQTDNDEGVVPVSVDKLLET